jgi:hypothetical protein
MVHVPVPEVAVTTPVLESTVHLPVSLDEYVIVPVPALAVAVTVWVVL